MIQKLSLFVALICIHIRCQNKNDGSESSSSKVDKIEYSEGETLRDWKCIEVGYDRVCYPKNWIPVQTDKSLFFAKVDTIHIAEFFGLAKLPTENQHLTIEMYLKEAYQQFKIDTFELLTGYTAKELIFEKSSGFYVEFSTQIGSDKYITYCMYTINKKFLYDFSLKSALSQKDQAYRNFQNILYNFRTNRKALFTKEDPLVEVKGMNLETI